MPAKVHCGDLFLGDTIQEKTRTLLGWSEEVRFSYIKVPTHIHSLVSGHFSLFYFLLSSVQEVKLVTISDLNAFLAFICTFPANMFAL